MLRATKIMRLSLSCSGALSFRGGGFLLSLCFLNQFVVHYRLGRRHFCRHPRLPNHHQPSNWLVRIRCMKLNRLTSNASRSGVVHRHASSVAFLDPVLYKRVSGG
ncbi:hypothetical protein EDB87DRAFT_351765 [Lactarius vividus]|nr:hypothetical protein EDB87DRAFT_351765 [Lactarius vividus]